MVINYLAVVTCAVLAMVVGAVWYGPLFGKQWMLVIGADKLSPEAQQRMMKDSYKLYLVQFLMTLFQVWVLAYYIEGWKEATGIANALWIYAAFILPMIIGNVLWTTDSSKLKWKRLLLQGGYQLVVFSMFGLVLGNWK